MNNFGILKWSMGHSTHLWLADSINCNIFSDQQDFREIWCEWRWKTWLSRVQKTFKEINKGNNLSEELYKTNQNFLYYIAYSDVYVNLIFMTKTYNKSTLFPFVFLFKEQTSLWNTFLFVFSRRYAFQQELHLL